MCTIFFMTNISAFLPLSNRIGSDRIESSKQVQMPDVRLQNRLVQYLATSAEAQVWRKGYDHHIRVAVSLSSSSLAKVRLTLLFIIHLSS